MPKKAILPTTVSPDPHYYSRLLNVRDRLTLLAQFTSDTGAANAGCVDVDLGEHLMTLAGYLEDLSDDLTAVLEALDAPAVQR